MALVKLQVRRDTAANWTASNPVLAAGEPGLETDTGKVKYGDGVRNWATLPYSSGVTLGDTAPPTAGSASTGVSTQAARADHSHALPESLSSKTLSTSGNATVGGSLTVNGALVGGSHKHSTGDIQDFSSTVFSQLAAALKAGSNITAAVDSARQTITLSAAGAAATPLAITSDPVDAMSTDGTARFQARASGGSGTIAYQWEQSKDNGATWTPISNATGTMLALASLVTADDGNQYRMRATAGDQSVTTLPATLRTAAVAITSEPPDITTTIGSMVSLAVAASAGSAAVTYQWQKRGSSSDSWEDVPGATNSTYAYTATAASDADGDQFRAVAIALGASVFSRAATVKINGPSLALFSQPASTPDSGGTASFTVEPMGGTPPYTYQWQRLNGSNSTWASTDAFADIASGTSGVSGVTSKTLSLTSQNAAQHLRKYRVVVTDANSASVTSAEATLSTLSLQITLQPSRVSVTDGTVLPTDAFKSLGTADGGVTYQWQTSADAGTTWTNIAGATGANYGNFTATLPDNNKLYRAAITGDGQTLNTDAATLSVAPGAGLSLTQQPPATANVAGSTGFAVTPFNIQWAGVPTLVAVPSSYTRKTETYVYLEVLVRGEWGIPSFAQDSWLRRKTASSGSATWAYNLRDGLVASGTETVSPEFLDFATWNGERAALVPPVDPLGKAYLDFPPPPMTSVGQSALATARSPSLSPRELAAVRSRLVVQVRVFDQRSGFPNIVRYDQSVTSTEFDMRLDYPAIAQQQYRVGSGAWRTAGNANDTGTWNSGGVSVMGSVNGGSNSPSMPTIGQTVELRIVDTNGIVGPQPTNCTPTIQWYKQGGSFSISSSRSFTPSGSPVAITGATGNTLTLSAVTLLDAGQFYPVATCGSRTAEPANGRFHLAPQIAPLVITTQPSDATSALGVANFVVAFSGGDGSTPLISWQRLLPSGNWSTITGAVSATLSLSSLTATLNGSQYRAVIKVGEQTVTSRAATLTVPGSAITLNPIDVVAATDGTATLAFDFVTDCATPVIVWERKRPVDTLWVPIPSADTKTLRLTGLAPDTSGLNVRASVRCNGITTYSSVATVAVASFEIFTSHPASQQVSPGQTVTLSFTTSLTPGTFSFLWQYRRMGSGFWNTWTGAASGQSISFEAKFLEHNETEYRVELFPYYANTSLYSRVARVQVGQTGATVLVDEMVGAQIVAVAYAKGAFVALSDYQTQIARRSTDNGATWRNTFLPASNWWDGIISTNSGRLIAYSSGKPVYGYGTSIPAMLVRSDDGGLTWATLPTPSIIKDELRMFYLPYQNAILAFYRTQYPTYGGFGGFAGNLASSAITMAVSLNDGATWQGGYTLPSAESGNGLYHISGVASSPSGKVVACTQVRSVLGTLLLYRDVAASGWGPLLKADDLSLVASYDLYPRAVHVGGVRRR